MMAKHIVITAPPRWRVSAVLVLVLGWMGALAAQASTPSTTGGLSVTVSGSPSPAPAGEPVTFTVVVANQGSSSFGYVQLDALVPGTLVSEGSGWPCQPENAGYLGCELGPMAAGAGATVTVTVAPAGGGPLVFTAYANTTRPQSITQRVQATVTVLPAAGAGSPTNATIGIGGWGLRRPFQTGESFRVVWSAVNPTVDQADVSSYDLRVRAAPPGQTLGQYSPYQTRVSPLVWTSLFSGDPGYTYCFSMRATTSGNAVSAWSPDTCTSIPLRASAMQLHDGCSRRSTSGGYLGQTVVCLGPHAEAALRIHRVRRIALVLGPCSDCGDAVVSIDDHRAETVHLPRTHAGPTAVEIPLDGRTDAQLSVAPALARRPIEIEGVDVLAVS